MSKRVKFILSWLVAALCLAIVCHQMDMRTFIAQIHSLDWRLVTLAILLDCSGYYFQGMRWSLLLKPVGRLTTFSATRAIYVGLFVNEIIPLRAGEAVRGVVAARKMAVPIPSIIASMTVERFFDAIWLAIGIGITAIFLPLPPGFTQAADILGGLVIGVAMLFTFIIFSKKKELIEKCGPLKKRDRVQNVIVTITNEIRTIGFSRPFFSAFFVSALFLATQILSFWLIMIACGLKTPDGVIISLWAGTVVLLIEHLGTAIPNAPANIGTYQLATIAGCALFGINTEAAAGFSMVVFILLTAPLFMLGYLALITSGINLKQQAEPD